MKVTARLAAVVVTTGIAGVGGLALVAPALAGTMTRPVAAVSQDDTTAATGCGLGLGAGPGYGNGRGAGAGAGVGNGAGNGAGAGMRNGVGPANGAGLRDGSCAVTAEQGTLSEDQRATLASMAQEEKLAHDLYATFADKYDAVVFDRIAKTEERHLATLRTLMERYEVTDPTSGQDTGKFTDQSVQATYDRLLAEGSKDEKAAFGVGKTVEQADVDDLRKAADGLSAPDVKQVYTNLVAASQRHLASFEAWSNR